MASDRNAFLILQSILRRDSTDTSYKYALLRALIEIVDEYDHLIISSTEAKAIFPFGLIIEKWLYYYYPIIAAELPQRNGADPNKPDAKHIAFRSEFKELIAEYREKGGYLAFVSDFRSGKLGKEDQIFIALIKKLKRTIADYPMKHLGYSHYQEHYQVVRPSRNWGRLTKGRMHSAIDPEFLIRNLGTFAIRRDFYETFRLLGGFISGSDAILFQWAKFTANAVDGAGVTVDKALRAILTSPDRERNIGLAKKTYLQTLRAQPLSCVWSGKPLTKKNLAVDHMIPFSIWGNNDLWNLLPSDSAVNGKKRDKIPRPEFVHERRDHIAEYWMMLRTRQADTFDQGMRLSLTGLQQQSLPDYWIDIGIEALKSKSQHLIEERGFSPWML